RLKGKLVMTGKATFFWKLLRLPTEFFSQRMAGDVILRQNSHTSIAKTLTETLLPMVIQIFMMVLYIVMLFRSSPVLTLFAVFALAVNLILGQVLADRRRNIMRMQLRDEGRLTGTTLYGIQMIETIKASGAEAEYFRRWAGQEAVVNAGAVKAARLELTLGAIPGAIRTFMNLLVMTGGVWLCMEGRFTLGGILLFQGVLTMLLTPAEGLIEAGSAIQKMNTDLERIEDVMDYPEAVCFHEEHEELTDR
ncbi:MAG: NHLP family bacteriocin export ABC transporter peptidase/permease/ATPase, partial [Lachnospiraceae bacterium]|nr:NHLP family bacteriocin export ABC transporter peptidase/permease/ATPase [Lachnospiraceae bacterium]